MIDIKKCNYIVGDKNPIYVGVSKIIDFLDVSGRNPIYLSKKDSTLRSYIRTSKLTFNNIDEFEKILRLKSNLFRVDLIFIDLLHIKNIKNILEYKELLDKTGIDYFIISKTYHYVDSDIYINVYKMERETNVNGKWSNDYQYYVTDIISGWKSTFSDLVISYKRDKKIDDVLGE